MKGNEFEVCKIWELMLLLKVTTRFSIRLDEGIESYTEF